MIPLQQSQCADNAWVTGSSPVPSTDKDRRGQYKYDREFIDGSQALIPGQTKVWVKFGRAAGPQSER